MRKGLELCTRAFVLFHDADREYAAKDSLALVARARAEPDALVVGTRSFSMGRPPWGSLFACGLVRRVLQWRHGADLSGEDVLSGTRVAGLGLWRSLGLTAVGFSIETEIVKRCIQKKVPRENVRVTYAPRTNLGGKKIRPWDLMRLLAVALR